jgi:hypothetical protein
LSTSASVSKPAPGPTGGSLHDKATFDIGWEIERDLAILIRLRPDPSVKTWVAAQRIDTLFIRESGP